MMTQLRASPTTSTPCQKLEVASRTAGRNGEPIGRVLLPMPFAKVNGSPGRIDVDAVLASQFADAPSLKIADQVTRLEEDMISGYYGGGTLYATPQRQEPWL